jgi:AICAR transformylase/IMP cyclohydrolase PurH
MNLYKITYAENIENKQLNTNSLSYVNAESIEKAISILKEFKLHLKTRVLSINKVKLIRIVLDEVFVEKLKTL